MLETNNYKLMNKHLLNNFWLLLHMTPQNRWCFPSTAQLLRFRNRCSNRATTLRYLQGESTKGFAKSPMVSAKAAKHILPEKGAPTKINGKIPSKVSHGQKTRGPLLSMKYWLDNRDTYNGYSYNPYITG